LLRRSLGVGTRMSGGTRRRRLRVVRLTGSALVAILGLGLFLTAAGPLSGATASLVSAARPHDVADANFRVVIVDTTPGNGAPIAPGGTITYGLTTSDTDDAPTSFYLRTPLVVTDQIPAGTTYVAGSASCGTLA